MIIKLPKSFYAERKPGNFVKVNGGVLEIHGPWDFEKLMIELTYVMKGRTKCFYCGERVEPCKITIDHLYPREFGGISITDNLEPACRKCNGQKSNMNQFEFRIWRTFSSEEARKRFFRNAIESKRARIRTNAQKCFDLPKKWIVFKKLNTIHMAKRKQNPNSDKYNRVLKFAKRNGQLPRPLVISSNDMLLDDTTTFNVAEELGFKKVPVIVLENVTFF